MALRLPTHGMLSRITTKCNETHSIRVGYVRTFVSRDLCTLIQLTSLWGDKLALVRPGAYVHVCTPVYEVEYAETEREEETSVGVDGGWVNPVPLPSEPPLPRPVTFG